MSRIIIESIADMPEPARGGLPFGVVLETDGPRVVAYGINAKFSAEGLRMRSNSRLRTYNAHFSTDDDWVEVHAEDVPAALQWLRRHFIGPFDLHIEPAPIYLGEFHNEDEANT